MLSICALVLLAAVYGAESSYIVAPKQMTGLVGGSITFKCYYPTATKANKHERKFFCKEQSLKKDCPTVISTTRFVGPQYIYRVNITDSPENNFFEVSMSELQLDDAGRYRCGLGSSNERGLYTKLNIVVSDDSMVPSEAELVYGQLRGQVSVNCPYTAQHATDTKYLCRIDKTGCRNIVNSKWNVDEHYMGRVMLNFAGPPNTFTVQIIHLKKEDAGHYSCGAGKYGEFGDSYDVDVHVSEETTIPQGRSLLTAALGGSVAAECRYNPSVDYKLKYWCKWRDHGCTQLIISNGYVKETMEGRITLHDSQPNGTLTILMNQLTKDDAGWYWCAFADDEHEYRFTMQVQLSEDKQGLVTPKLVTVAPGDPVRLPCLYDCKYNQYEKYWCKWNSGRCDPVTCSKEVEGGQSVSCDTETKEIVLSIPSASVHDEGLYWCGVLKDGRYGETSVVHLMVSEPERPDVVLPPEEDNVFPVDAGPREGAGRSNIDASGDVSSQEPKSSHVLPIALSLSAVVLLIAAAVFLVFRLRARKNSDLVSVGSFRTNISLSELDNARGAGKENPAAVDTQDTEIGHDQKNIKKSPQGSKEDLAYMSCLIRSEETSA